MAKPKGYVEVELEVSKDKKTASIHFISDHPMTSDEVMEVMRAFILESERDQQGELIFQ